MPTPDSRLLTPLLGERRELKPRYLVWVGRDALQLGARQLLGHAEAEPGSRWIVDDEDLLRLPQRRFPRCLVRRRALLIERARPGGDIAELPEILDDRIE